MISKWLRVLGAASLFLASGGAAQAAAPLSLPNAARSGAEVAEANEIRGTAKYIVGGIALALIIWGAIELFDNEDEAFPTSP